MTLVVDDYFLQGWRERVIACACGWSGDSRAMRMTLQDTLTDYACPGCESTVLTVAHPDIERVRSAAAEGNEEARAQLDLVEEARRHLSARTAEPG